VWDRSVFLRRKGGSFFQQGRKKTMEMYVILCTLQTQKVFLGPTLRVFSKFSLGLFPIWVDFEPNMIFSRTDR
jgi:hypothetical protein